MYLRQNEKFNHILNSIKFIQKKTERWPLYWKCPCSGTRVDYLYDKCFENVDEPMFKNATELKQLIRFLEESGIDTDDIRRMLMYGRIMQTSRFHDYSSDEEEIRDIISAFHFKHRNNKNVYNICKNNIDRMLVT